jgi:DNA-directed RNA polymerase sigma subunit (sigma70/sigma32)
MELRCGLDGESQSLGASGRELQLTREGVRQLEGQALAKLSETLGALAPADEDELALAA